MKGRVPASPAVCKNLEKLTRKTSTRVRARARERSPGSCVSKTPECLIQTAAGCSRARASRWANNRWAGMISRFLHEIHSAARARREKGCGEYSRPRLDRSDNGDNGEPRPQQGTLDSDVFREREGTKVYAASTPRLLLTIARHSKENARPLNARTGGALASADDRYRGFFFSLSLSLFGRLWSLGSVPACMQTSVRGGYGRMPRGLFADDPWPRLSVTGLSSFTQ